MKDVFFANRRTELYPACEPYEQGMLKVSDVHTIYWEQCGNPSGIPVLFLHGGPGGGCSPGHRRFFDPTVYRIVLFDQRGCGRSTPVASTQENTTAHLIEDIERIRTMLHIDRWLVFGGSWGSTLGLAYGQTYPHNCLGFILRGIFLAREQEVHWFMHGMGQFFPQAQADLLGRLTPDELQDPMQAYARRIADENNPQRAQDAAAFAQYEARCMYLVPQETIADTRESLAVGTLETHYLSQRCFLKPNQLLQDLSRIGHLPAIIVQGRYDVVCPPRTAWDLHQAWHALNPTVQLTMTTSGHSAFEHHTTQMLVAATEWFKMQLSN